MFAHTIFYHDNADGCDYSVIFKMNCRGVAQLCQAYERVYPTRLVTGVTMFDGAQYVLDNGQWRKF